MGKKVKVASFGLNRAFLAGKKQEEIVPVIIDKIESVRGYHPDLIVLPEAFLEIGGDEFNPRWQEIAAQMLEELRRFAREMNCYIVAPLHEPYPGSGELRFNTVFFLDRRGEVIGKYRKVHTVYEESIVNHLVPGREIPVFDTDFGRVGFQICFDIGWRDGWKELADQGAELVIWVSAYDGGNLLNTYAAYNMYWVVSSVRSDHAQVIDITGRTVAEGSKWNGLALTTIDLGMRLYHKDRQFQKIDAIRRALGDKVSIHGYSEENVFTVESNDPEWPLDRIEREFGIMNYKDYHAEATRLQEEWREKYPLLPEE